MDIGQTDQAADYREIAVEVPADEVELVGNYIIENIAGGLLLEDEDDSNSIVIKFYAAESARLDSTLDGLKAFLVRINPGHAGISFRQKPVKNLDWIEAYKKSVAPILIGNHIVIKPPWSDESFPGRVEVLIEPKMAFGTGRHETTQGCLATLQECDLAGKAVLDLGCGSGILGIFAALKGAASVSGYDIDPLAVDNSRENFVVNGVAAVCRADLGSIDSVNTERRFDVIIANIIKSAILPILKPMKRILAPQGILILSGLLRQDQEEIDAALRSCGWDQFAIRRDGEWLTYRVQGS